jgi:hypothetical protein
VKVFAAYEEKIPANHSELMEKYYHFYIAGMRSENERIKGKLLQIAS